MIDVKELKNYEKIRMYRNNFDVSSEIRNKCKNELELLKNSSKKPINGTAKIMIIVLVLFSVIMAFINPVFTVIGIIITIILIIVSAKNRNNSLEFDEDYQKKRNEIIEKYNAMGYFPQIGDDEMLRGNVVCGDYDDINECYICSVDGHTISYWDYEHRCNNSNQCPHCKKRLSAMGPDGWFLEHPPRPIDESISQYFYNI